MKNEKQYFIDLVCAEFNFLVKEFEFSMSIQDSYSVYFENDVVIIKFYFDYYQSLEVICSIKVKSYENDIYIYDVMEFVHYKGEIVFSREEPNIYQKITNSVLKLRNFFQSEGKNCLLKNSYFFSLLVRYKEEKINQYNVKRDLEYLKTQLDILWNNRKYSEIVTLLSPMRTWLNKSEIMKLEYAKKHLHNRQQP